VRSIPSNNETLRENNNYFVKFDKEKDILRRRRSVKTVEKILTPVETIFSVF